MTESHRPSRLVLVACLIMGCGTGSDRGRTTRSDSVTTTETDTTKGRGPTAVRSADTGQVLDDFAGFYLPVDLPRFRGGELKWLGVNLTRSADITLILTGSTASATYTCPLGVVNKEKVELDCPIPNGMVRVRGAFVDRRGQFAARSDLPGDTVVLIADVTFRIGEQEEVAKQVRFTWFEGE